MKLKKSIHSRMAVSCLEEPELQLQIIKASEDLKNENQILWKSKVHILFCLQAPVIFHFGPVYSRTLPVNRAFIIYNPDNDLSTNLELTENSIIIHLCVSLQRLHQLLIPENQTAILFKLFENPLKSYEEIEIEAEMLLVLNQLVNKSQNNSTSRLFYQAKIFEIFSLLYTKEPSQAGNCPFLKNESTVRKIKLAKDLLLKEFKDPPTIPELAKSVQLNEFQLKSGFKEIYGMGPYHFLLAHKLEIAKQLLLSGEYQVQEAAYLIGYSNTSHFIGAFRKRFGMTPKKIIMKN